MENDLTPTKPHPDRPRKHKCPLNGKEYSAVGRKTILHHLATPWENALREQRYYFCSDANCDAVYFGRDDTVISISELRTIVGAKQGNPERTICYCFGISFSVARDDSRVVRFVQEQTKQSLCSCEVSNPSGRCCLGDFPKH